MMSYVTYKNRKGEVYHMYWKRTKAGRVTYYVSRRPSEAGTPATKLPGQMEFYEHPGKAVVTVRKILPSKIDPAEVGVVWLALEQEANLKPPFVFAGQEAKMITVWVSNGKMTPPDLLRHTDEMFPISARTPRSAEIRFVLDEDDDASGATRQFVAERLCSRGSEDRWISLARGSLEKLAPALCRHLGKMSFYELYPWERPGLLG